jgi:hypothetical protein
LKNEEKLDKILVFHKNNRNIGDLFEVKFKIYNYLNQNEQIIKTISKTIEIKFIKQIAKTEFDGQFQKNCSKTESITLSFYCFSFVDGIVSLSIPPLAFGFFVASYTFGGISLSSFEQV